VHYAVGYNDLRQHHKRADARKFSLSLIIQNSARKDSLLICIVCQSILYRHKLATGQQHEQVYFRILREIRIQVATGSGWRFLNPVHLQNKQHSNYLVVQSSRSWEIRNGKVLVFRYGRWPVKYTLLLQQKGPELYYMPRPFHIFNSE
jgi:hypothetical protein